MLTVGLVLLQVEIVTFYNGSYKVQWNASGFTMPKLTAIPFASLPAAQSSPSATALIVGNPQYYSSYELANTVWTVRIYATLVDGQGNSSNVTYTATFDNTHPSFATGQVNGQSAIKVLLPNTAFSGAALPAGASLPSVATGFDVSYTLYGVDGPSSAQFVPSALLEELHVPSETA